MRRSRMLQSAKRVMAWGLCVILLADSAGAYAMAAGEAEIAETVCAQESENTLYENAEAESLEGDCDTTDDGADFAAEQQEDEELRDDAVTLIAEGVVTSGAAKGVNWKVDESGLLTIYGTASAEPADIISPTWYRGWKEYASEITKAKVTAQNLISTNSLFADLMSLETVDMSECDLSNVIDMGETFKNCEQLKSIDFGDQKVSGLQYSPLDMFWGCYSLTGLDLSGFELTNHLGDSFLDDCISLEWLKTPAKLTEFVLLPVLMQDETGERHQRVPQDAGILLTKYTASAEETVDSGNFKGLDWELKGDGSLTISGVYDDTLEFGHVWEEWKQFVTSVKITAGNIPDGLYTENGPYSSRWFRKYKQLKSVDLSGCSFEKVTDLSWMFSGCPNLKEVNFGNADIGNVTNMGGMFYGCIGLESIHLNGLDTHSVKSMESMFCGCTNLKDINLNGVNTENVTNMQAMFEDCKQLSVLDLKSFKTENVENMSMMFFGCKNLSALAVSGFDTGNVIDFSYIFGGCTKLQNLSVNHFKTGKAENMSLMFSGCKSLTGLELSQWDTQNVKDMHSMFSGCSALTALDLSNFNTHHTENMDSMFFECENLQTLKVDNFDTSNVTDMRQMFAGCQSLEELDLSGWNTEKAKMIQGIFMHCYNLKALNMSSLNFSSVTDNASYILSGDDQLETIQTPLQLKVSVALPYKMYDSKGKAYTELPKNAETSITLTKKKGQGGNDKPVIVLPKLEIALTDEDAEFSYTGTAVCPAVTVVVEGKTLTAGVDYTVKYTNNVNASVKVNGDGTLAVGQDGAYIAASAKRPTVTVTAKGNYSGSASAYFTILPKDLSEVCPGGMELKAEEGTKPAVTLWDGDAKLAAKDYVLKNGSADSSTVYKPAAVKAGETLNLTAVGKGNYMGTAAITVTAVAKKSLNPITVTPVKSFKGFEYNGSSRKPVFGGAEAKNDADEDVQVVVSSKTAPKTEEGGKGLVEGEDYYVLYSADTTNAGTVKYTVVGMGDYTGSVSKSYKINPIKAKSGLKVSYDKTKRYPFAPAGSVIDDITVTFSNASLYASTNALLNGEELTEGKDYKISYSGNKKAGTGKFTVTFLGNYKGSTALKNNEFTIRPVSFAELAEQGRVKILLADKTAKKGGVYKSAPIVTVDDVLLKASNYTVTYYTDEAMTTLMDKKNGKELELTAEKPSATVWVKIEGKGNYAGGASSQGGTSSKDAALTELDGEALSYEVYQTDGKTTGDMSKAKVTLATKSFTYTGGEITPAKSNFTVTCKVGSETVTLDESQYDVTYINNVNRGKATVLITGNGASGSKNKYTFAGSKTATFTIAVRKVQ